MRKKAIKVPEEKKSEEAKMSDTFKWTKERHNTVLHFLVNIIDYQFDNLWYIKAKPETKKLHKEIRNLIAETFGVTDENLYALIGANRTKSEKDFCKTYRFLIDIYYSKTHRSDYEKTELDEKIYLAITDLFKISSVQIGALGLIKDDKEAK
jgi:hypothetical protein